MVQERDFTCLVLEGNQFTTDIEYSFLFFKVMFSKDSLSQTKETSRADIFLRWNRKTRRRRRRRRRKRKKKYNFSPKYLLKKNTSPVKTENHNVYCFHYHFFPSIRKHISNLNTVLIYAFELQINMIMKVACFDQDISSTSGVV